MVEENTKVDPGDGIVNIGIVEDNVRALASKFEGHLLEIRSGSRLHDLSANNCATGKGNLVNVHVGRHGSTSRFAESRDDVDDTGRETSLLDELGGEEGS